MVLDFFLSSKILLVTQIFLLLIVLVFSVLNWKNIYNFLKKNYDKNDMLVGGGIVLIALGIRVFYFDGFYYTNDEYMYIQGAKEVYDTYSIAGNTRVIGWISLLVGVFGIFGFSSFVGSLFTLFLSLGSVGLFYLILRYIFCKKHIAIFSSLLFSVLPFHVFWSDKLETNIPSLFFILLTLFIYFIHLDTKILSTFLWAMFLSFFTTTFRGENIVLYIPLLILFFTHTENFLHFKRLFSILLGGILGSMLVFSNYLHQYVFTHSLSWNYGAGENISFMNFRDNIQLFTGGFLDNRLFFFYNYIALFGFFFLLYNIFLKKYIAIKQTSLLLFLAIFFSLFGIYNLIWLPYVYGVDRLYMEVYPIYILFFGVGISGMIYIFQAYIKNKNLQYIFYIVLICLTLSNISSQKNYLKVSEKHILQAYLSNDFLSIYDETCLYLVFYPFYYEGYVDNFTYTHTYEFLSNETLQKDVFSTFSCVMFVDDKFCNDRSPGNKFSGPDGKNSNEYCDEIKNDFFLEKVRIYTLHQKSYGIYRIAGKK